MTRRPRLAIGALAGIPRALRNVPSRIALCVSLGALVLATGTKGPIAAPYTWLVLHVKEIGVYRELYDLVAFVAIGYVVLLASGIGRGIALALARELDQRAVAVRGLDPDPGRRELDLVGASAERALDGQEAGRQQHPLAIGRVAAVDQQRRADGDQLDAGERHDERRAAQPEGAGDGERPGAEREIDRDKLRRRHRAVAAQ